MLLVVAWNMVEWKHFAHVLKVAPSSDTLVLVTCFVLMVFVDMAYSVSTGVVMAAVLFMRRMAELSNFKLLGEGHAPFKDPLPKGVVIYQVAGPLFFGAAQKAMSALVTGNFKNRMVILDLTAAPVIDVTGLVALESAIKKLHSGKSMVLLAGLQEQPMSLLKLAGIENEEGKIALCRTLEEAVELAKRSATEQGPAVNPSTAAHALR
jgi:SulP family sulfate permease